jgi:hypothetical protein
MNITSKLAVLVVKLLISNCPVFVKTLHAFSIFSAIVRFEAARDFSKAAKHELAN